MRNYIPIIVSAVASAMVTVILMAGFVQWKISDRDEGLPEKVRKEIDARMMDVAFMLEKQQAERNMHRYPDPIMMGRGLSAMDEIDEFFGFRKPSVCFPFPWCLPYRKSHSFLSQMHSHPATADSSWMLDKSWHKSSDGSNKSYSVTWYNQSGGDGTMRYYHLFFEPPTKEKLQSVNGSLVPQKTICMIKKNKTEQDVKYHLTNAGKRSIIWKEVDLGNGEPLATSWLLDVYFDVEDFRLVDGELYVKLAGNDDILTISLDNGKIKDKGLDTKKIFASELKQSCN